MNRTRREFCGATGAVFLSGMTLSETVSAQQSSTVTGSVQSAVGTSVDDGHIVFSNHETREWTRAEISASGQFEAALSETGEYDLIFFHQPIGDTLVPDFNGIPVSADLTTMEITDGQADAGSFTIPQGHRMMVRIVNNDGNPLQNVPLSFYLPSGAGTGSSDFTTNANGYVQHVDASDPGIELAGPMTTRLHPRSDDAEFKTLGRVLADKPREETFILTDPGEYTNIIERSTDGDRRSATPMPDPSTAQASATQSALTPAQPSDSSGSTTSDAQRRGFFSNSGDEPAFISDPLNLTTLGFFLSVAGIAHQMIRGQ